MSDENNIEREIRDEEQELVRHSPLGREDERKPQGEDRIVIRFTSFRHRLLDDDNLSGGCKGLRDGLTAAGLIPDDSPRVIAPVIYDQQVIPKKATPFTVIQITYPE